MPARRGWQLVYDVLSGPGVDAVALWMLFLLVTGLAHLLG